MRPAITGDAKALREALEHTAVAISGGRVQAAMSWLQDAAAAIDLPEPEATAKAEEEPDYICPICHLSIYNRVCHHTFKDAFDAANRRIKELERERDEAEKALELFEYDTDAAYAKGAEDFRESVAMMFNGTAASLVRAHPIPKPKEEAP